MYKTRILRNDQLNLASADPGFFYIGERGAWTLFFYKAQEH